MAHFRFSLATLMAVVLVVAVNLVLGDYWFDRPEMEWSDLVHAGTRPMASILAIGVASLLAARARARPRPFLAGFVVCGMIALLAYLATTAMFSQELHSAVRDGLRRFMSPGSPQYPWSVMLLCLAPQLLVALVGGWLYAWYEAREH